MTMNEIWASLTPAQNAALDRWIAESHANGEVYDCGDNDRVAVKGNAEQEALYDAAYESGCCGSCDMELQCDDGTTLLYGFNYGH